MYVFLQSITQNENVCSLNLRHIPTMKGDPNGVPARGMPAARPTKRCENDTSRIC